MNAYRCTKDGGLDRKYLRVCAVYRLLKAGRIGAARAVELLAQRHTEAEMKSLRGTLDLWRAGQIRNMLT